MNFSLILFLLVLFTGFFYCLDLLIFKPRRKYIAMRVYRDSLQNPELTHEARAKIHLKLMRQPLWLEYSASFFPVILFVFILRSFVVEPFKIPSGSMIPTLLIGDYILVNKFSYGIRLPIVDKKIIPVSNPKPGDVMVFRYPNDPKLDYIKRVIGVGGDKIEYKNKRLTINGKQLPIENAGKFYEQVRLLYTPQFKETLNGKTHFILNDEDAPPYVTGAQDFEFRENCSYDVSGFKCVVPQDHYFMMGDNRDNSSDSRIWGFVSDKQVVGKAFLVWMNFSDFGRIGKAY